jgi:hypothetical protein
MTLTPSQELGFAFDDLSYLLKEGGAPAWVLVVTTECKAKYVVGLRKQEQAVPPETERDADAA